MQNCLNVLTAIEKKIALRIECWISILKQSKRKPLLCIKRKGGQRPYAYMPTHIWRREKVIKLWREIEKKIEVFHLSTSSIVGHHPGYRNKYWWLVDQPLTFKNRLFIFWRQKNYVFHMSYCSINGHFPGNKYWRFLISFINYVMWFMG